VAGNGCLWPRPVLLIVLLLIAQGLERAGPRCWAAGWLALAGNGLYIDMFASRESCSPTNWAGFSQPY